jgi:hypothetical protein
METTMERNAVEVVNVGDGPGNSAVAWGAILAGAAAAAALSLVLLILGTGLGLSSVSPWSHEGLGVKTFGIATILWITFTQLFASGLGGYLAGRLRTRWMAVHTDEVYFRDTAHGFLAWCVASLATAALLTSVIGSIVNSGVQAGTTVATGAATAGIASGAAVASAGGFDSARVDSRGGPMGYFVDSLFRKDASAGGSAADSSAPARPDEQSTVVSTAEVSRIYVQSLSAGSLSTEDARYVGQVVAQRTGLTQADAEKRATDTFVRLQTKMRETETAAREAADKARKGSAYAALWLFISLLSGAFVASLAATYGGRQRDL